MVKVQAPDHYAVGWPRPSRRRAHPISDGAGWRSNSPRLPISPFTGQQSLDRSKVRAAPD